MDFDASELILIRHGESDAAGRLVGRTDVGLRPGVDDEIAKLAAVLPEVSVVHVSPARRCRETAIGLWPKARHLEEPGLWEQDFGALEDLDYREVPDQGVLSREALAGLAAPGGESFSDLCRRVHPVLRRLIGEKRDADPVVVVAHAGVVRAAIAMALESVPLGLAFRVDPLSLTRLACHQGGVMSVSAVNWRMTA